MVGRQTESYQNISFNFWKLHLQLPATYPSHLPPFISNRAALLRAYLVMYLL